MTRSKISRRKFIAKTALATTALVAAPYMRTSYAAGKLAIGAWDHWVPGANDTLTAIVNEWGEKNKVEIHIDYITTIGDKDLLTGSAEAQAGTGHDIFSHRAWQITVHRAKLEPTDDVISALIKDHGPIADTCEYLSKFDGHWMGIPAICGSQVKPCCSRIDLYKKYCDVDIVKMFPGPGVERDKALVESWDWAMYLKTAEQLFKGGFPVGLPMGQTSDAIDWVGALFRGHGSVFVDEKDQIKIDSPETRTVLEYAAKLMAANSPERLCLGRRRQQPLAHLGQGLEHHESAERLGRRGARQPSRGRAVLDPRHAARTQGPLRPPPAVHLRHLEFRHQQDGRQGARPLYRGQAASEASRCRLERLRPAVLQELL